MHLCLFSASFVSLSSFKLDFMDFIKTYFSHEKAESLLFIGAGVIGTLFSLYCWMSLRKPFYNGMAFPLLILGAIQLAVGTTIYLRSPKDMERILNYATLEPEKLQDEEILRMRTVMQNFMYYRYLELLFITAGILLMFYVSPSEFVKGVGFALFVEASLMLAGDYFAERRGEIYLQQLQQEVSPLNRQSNATDSLL
jgi:hypothetical protein